MPKVTLNNDHPTTVKRPGLGPNLSNFPRHPSGPSGPPGGRYQPVLPGNKRPPSGLSLPVAKKIKIGVLRDVTLSEAGKYGTLNEYAFFDKVRKALKNKDAYEDFLRCLVLFNQEVISRTELVQLTAPFLNRYPGIFQTIFIVFLAQKIAHHSNLVRLKIKDSNLINDSQSNGFDIPKLVFNC